MRQVLEQLIHTPDQVERLGLICLTIKFSFFIGESPIDGRFSATAGRQGAGPDPRARLSGGPCFCSEAEHGRAVERAGALWIWGLQSLQIRDVLRCVPLY